MCDCQFCMFFEILADRAETHLSTDIRLDKMASSDCAQHAAYTGPLQFALAQRRRSADLFGRACRGCDEIKDGHWEYDGYAQKLKRAYIRVTAHEDGCPLVQTLHSSGGPREKLHNYMDAVRGLSDAEQRAKLTQAARIVLIDELVRQEVSSSTIRQVVKRARQQWYTGVDNYWLISGNIILEYVKFFEYIFVKCFVEPVSAQTIFTHWSRMESRQDALARRKEVIVYRER